MARQAHYRARDMFAATYRDLHAINSSGAPEGDGTETHIPQDMPIWRAFQGDSTLKA
jgi:hypothetical protein